MLTVMDEAVREGLAAIREKRPPRFQHREVAERRVAGRS
jgi:hypothetical protein